MPAFQLDLDQVVMVVLGFAVVFHRLGREVPLRVAIIVSSALFEQQVNRHMVGLEPVFVLLDC